MGSELVALERQLEPLAPHFEQVLANVMPVERLIRTALVSVERNPNLLNCDRQSFLNTIMSSAVLGLEMDGVTGQAFPIPFKNKVQLVIGYKGYNTLAARSGLTITGDIVREKDAFDFDKGEGWIKHKPAFQNRGGIIGAWAKASANDRPAIIEWMSLEELMEVKGRSPGAKRSDSPWNDTKIGFPAMCAKTVKRRLCRSTPLNTMQLAARMEEAFEEQGQHSYIRQDRTVITEGDALGLPTKQPNGTPQAEMLMGTKAESEIIDGEIVEPDPLANLKADGKAAAARGMDELKRWWEPLSKDQRKALVGLLDGEWKGIAAKADKARTNSTDEELYDQRETPDVAMTDDEASGYLDLKIAALKDVHDLDELSGLDAGVKKALKGHDDLIGRWNAAKLECERNIKAKVSA